MEACPEWNEFVYCVPARGFCEQRQRRHIFVSLRTKISGAVPCSQNAPIAGSIQIHSILDKPPYGHCKFKDR